MGKHFISMCMFCFLCAAHSPCASHAELTRHTKHSYDSKKFPGESSPEPMDLGNYHERLKPPNLNLKPSEVNSAMKHTDKLKNLNHSAKFKSILSKQVKRSVYSGIENSKNDKLEFSDNVADSSKSDNKTSELFILKELFVLYGDGKTMSIEGFEKFLRQMDLISQVYNRGLSNSHFDDLSTQEAKNSNTHNSVSTCYFKSIFVIIIYINSNEFVVCSSETF